MDRPEGPDFGIGLERRWPLTTGIPAYAGRTVGGRGKDDRGAREGQTPKTNPPAATPTRNRQGVPLSAYPDSANRLRPAKGRVVNRAVSAINIVGRAGHLISIESSIAAIVPPPLYLGGPGVAPRRIQMLALLRGPALDLLQVKLRLRRFPTAIRRPVEDYHIGRVDPRRDGIGPRIRDGGSRSAVRSKNADKRVIPDPGAADITETRLCVKGQIAGSGAARGVRG